MKNDIQESEQLANDYRDMWQSLLFCLIFIIPFGIAFLITH
ncbi:hypothetical protein FHX59_006949 [Paraburkholderia silvatlantica]|uniref:Aa3 type cytochrome c oxidase subunit IV n=1 Tax=Paraburkholderia silvatlantica TaxID=321895 RepID=A0ABR6FYF8_9BURK|nr:hypothetical protein [Paraburkholderia silvatlantica]PVY22355.1 hypothetical protein C7411_13259 [Paraburkholderia silvatlantica]PXW27870.1 hypothetical protein C7413_13359 [Paraburkholderia silvatlantica]